jgi:hypothetical protein
LFAYRDVSWVDSAMSSRRARVDGSPQVALLPLNPEEDLVNVERVAEAPMSAPQSTRVLWSERVAPWADRFVADDEAPPG